MLLRVQLCLLALLAVSYQEQTETALTAEDFANADTVDPGDGVTDPTQDGMFEGDIHLNGHTIQQYIDQDVPDDPGIQRNGIRSVYARWPNAQIPYSVSSGFSQTERARIASAIEDYHKYTCIRWVPRTSQSDYVYLFQDGGCYSMVGRQGGRQSLSLGNGCTSKGIIMHEMMHAAGFFHEQSRNDRDNYIRIRTDNMIAGTESQFRKYSLQRITHLGTSYDYGSIMHYGKYAFSKNRQPTIEPLRSGAEIGQRRALSSNDIVKLNKLYSCDGPSVPQATRAPTRPPTGGACDDDRDDCALFSRQRGGCSLQWMRRLCRETCGLCRGGPSPPDGCEDSSMLAKHCDGFARKGYCSNSGAIGRWMERNCCATCKKY